MAKRKPRPAGRPATAVGRSAAPTSTSEPAAPADDLTDALVLPDSVRKLDATARAVWRGMVVARLEELRARAELDELAGRARELGVPWSAIGAAIGVTAEGARRRFS